MKKVICLNFFLLFLVGCFGGSIQKDSLQSQNLDFQAIIEGAKEKVFPALVFVKPIQEEFGGGEKQKMEVLGSGVIISPDGLVVTNHHVAEKSVQINCVLSDKKQIPAKVIGLDQETDLALLQLEVPKEDLPLPYAEFADSDQMMEGQFVMALGSPFGFTRSISLGIVSHINRYLGFETLYKYNNWIQTDAAINPGNSGGPLVNTEGKIVGINTLGIFWADNVGFSIPSNVVTDVVSRLKEKGRVERVWTGVKLQALNDFESNTFTPGDHGVLIPDVEPQSPAEAAGIIPGDLLAEINGEPVNGLYIEELPAIRVKLAYLSAGVPAQLTIERNGVPQKFILTPELKGKVEGEDFDCRRWDMTVKEISKFQNPELYFLKKGGVFIQGVKYEGNAADAGLGTSDIILKIDEKPMETLEDVKKIYEEILKDETRGKKVLFEILRNGYTKWIVLDYRKDYEEVE